MKQKPITPDDAISANNTGQPEGLLDNNVSERKRANSYSGRLLAQLLSSSEEHWADTVANKVLEIFPDAKMHTCAAGISPSGIVHFGNFRDIMTSYAVMKMLQKKGKKARLLFSWDDYDRFRKVPVGIDESYKKYIGMPLSAVPDPTGEFPSYARGFQTEFEKSLAEMKIELDYRYQTHEYKSGRYDKQIFYCLSKRQEIAKILLSFMSEKGKEEKKIAEKEYIAGYYPIAVYSRFTGKDTTEILAYNGGTRVKYKCLETGKEDEVDLVKERIAKLAWKIDWPMRWVEEGVTFEPGGHDHASPGGSYDTASVISQKIFDRPGPVFVGYEFIGLQGLKGKMSGSKGNAVSPATLLEIYEPRLLKWVYLRREPNQHFQLAFDSEINRQYEEFDRDAADAAKSSAESKATGMTKELSPAKKTAIELSFADLDAEYAATPLPFRHAVALGQIVQWEPKKVRELLKGMDVKYDEDSIEVRLNKARAWLETYNPEETIRLRDEINHEYLETMTENAKTHMRKLHEDLQKGHKTIPKLELLVYSIPKNPKLSDKENSPLQRAFFKDIYQLLIGKDTGPRLATFLWAVEREKVLKLLDI